MYVYILTVPSGAIKVGIAKNIPTRRNQVQTGNHEPVSVSLVLDVKNRNDAFAIEKSLHRIFTLSGRRLEGEWFAVSLKEAKAIIDFAIMYGKRGVVASTVSPKVAKLLDHRTPRQRITTTKKRPRKKAHEQYAPIPFMNEYEVKPTSRKAVSKKRKKKTEPKKPRRTVLTRLKNLIRGRNDNKRSKRNSKRRRGSRLHSKAA